MTTYSQAQLLRDLVKQVFPRDLVEGQVVVGANTSTTVVTLAELYSTRASQDTYSGGYVYVYAGTGSGQWRRVDTYDPYGSPGYGAVSLTRPLPLSPDATSQVLLYNGGRSPAELKQDINLALARTYRKRYLVATLVDDGNMEANDVSSWTQVGSATLTKSTATTVFEGARALSIVTGGAGVNGAQSSAVATTGGETVWAEVVSRCTLADPALLTMTFRALNPATGVVLATVTHTNKAPTRLRLQVQVPAATSSIAFQLLNSVAGTTLWDDLAVWKPNVLQTQLPSEVTSEAQVLGVYRRLTRGSVSGAQYDPFASELHRVAEPRLSADPALPGRVSLGTYGPTAGWPYVIEALLPLSALSSDSEEVLLPNEPDFLARAKAITWQELAQQGTHDDRSFYEKQAQRARPGASRAAAFGPRGRQNVRAT